MNLAFGSRGLSAGVDRDSSKESSARPLGRRHTDSRVGDVRDSQADQTRLKKLFSDARPVRLEDGLSTTVTWFEAELH